MTDKTNVSPDEIVLFLRSISCDAEPTKPRAEKISQTSTDRASK